MPTVNAIVNHGRWIVICPACAAQGVTVAMEVAPGELFVCPEENPNILATTLMPNPRVPGEFNAIPDEPLREEARQAAITTGSAYEVIFPRDKKRIENILRLRPVSNRHWEGATLDELRRGNAERGLSHD